ncbi:MAG: hypothetical protein HYU64_12060 [Armatimonadetes bacterium]|nr:hypothetical protein [Armatimonadota bacterium]
MDTWATLIKTMDPDVHFTIVLEKETDLQTVHKLMKSHKFPNPERFHFIMCNDINITMWSRDQMVGLFGPTDDAVLLAQTTMRPHGQDPLIPPRIVAANKGIVLDPDKRLVTDGGDEVSNRRETFLGYTSLYLTAQHLHDLSGAKTSFKDEENTWLLKARALFEEKYGKPVTVIGADDPTTPEIERPATFHIDMGLTPVDDNTILVGDPREAIKIIQSLPKDEYEAYNKKLRDVLGESGDVLQRLMDANTIHDPDLQHQFDYNADHLRGKGYNVIRMPFLQGPPGVSWITYNNCLMETYTRPDGSDVRRVFLPTYGLPALDRKAEEIYNSQGFQVIPLNLASLTTWKGAIRCISNILGKQPEA